ncbi:MAG: SMC family ATPase [Candidatus Heimdallarchaeota archaeon]|nr:SMC family ATPase [Candidatus Heimdallarchaeota archaeon]
MIEIKKLELQGIRSYTQKEFADFEDGTTVIIGDNGSGKSTMLESIKFCLFGKFDEEGLAEYMNGNEAKLKLVFSLFGKEHLVKRTMKLNKGNKVTHPKSYLKYWEDNQYKELETKNKGEVDQKIMELIGIHENLIHNSIFIPQGGINSIIDMNGTKRRQEFEEIFDLKKYDTLRLNWYRVKRKYNDKIKETKKLIVEKEKKKVDIKKKENDISELSEKSKLLEIAKNDSLNAYTKIKQVQEERKGLEGQIEKMTQTIKGTMEKVEAHEKTINKKTESLKVIKPEDLENLSQYTEENKTLTKDLDYLNAYIEKLDEPRKAISVQQEARRGYLGEIENNEKKLIETLKIEDVGQSDQIIEKMDQELKEDIQNHSDLTEHKNLYDETLKKITALKTDQQKLEQSFSEYVKLDLGFSPLSNIIKEDYNQIPEKIKKEHQEIKEKIDTKKMESKELLSKITERKTTKKKKEKIIEQLEDFKEGTRCDTCYSLLAREDIDGSLELLKGEIAQYAIDIDLMTSNLSTLEKEQKEFEKKEEPLKLFIKRDKGKETAFISIINEYKDIDISELEKLIGEYKEKRYDQINTKDLKELNKKNNEKQKVLIELNGALKQFNKANENLAKSDKIIEDNQKSILSIKSKYKINEEYEESKKRQQKIKVRKQSLTDDLLLATQIETELKLKSSKLDDVENYQKEINETREKLKENKFDNIDEQLKQAKEKLDEDDKLFTDNSNNITNLRNEITNQKGRDEEVKDLKKKIAGDKKNSEYAKNMEKIFGDIGPRILSNKTANVQRRVNSIMTQMPSTRQIVFEIDKDFNFMTKRGEKMLNVKRLSGGEKMSLAFAIRVALSKEIVDMGLLVLDEPTDSLDKDRKKKMAEILGQQTHVKQLIVITHDEAFNSMIDNCITVEYSGGSSRIR